MPNEWLDEKYGSEIKIHAYSPQESMGANQKRFVYDYAYCVCLFGTKLSNRLLKRASSISALSYGVEPVGVSIPRKAPSCTMRRLRTARACLPQTTPRGR